MMSEVTEIEILQTDPQMGRFFDGKGPLHLDNLIGRKGMKTYPVKDMELEGIDPVCVGGLDPRLKQNNPGKYEVHVWVSLPRKAGGRFKVRLVNPEFRHEPAWGIREIPPVKAAVNAAFDELWLASDSVRVWFFKGRPYGKFLRKGVKLCLI